MHKFLRKGLLIFLGAAIAVPFQSVFSQDMSRAAAAGKTRIHYLTLAGDNEAILLESNGHFGMVDSGEDTDFPDGSDPRYPDRNGIVKGVGFEDEVISYLKSVGVTNKNFDFYIGTHPHSDHIGTADEIIREFQPERVYIQEYKDSYISSSGNLWDNLYVYDNMIEAAQEVGAAIIQNFDPTAPVYPESDSSSLSAVTDTPDSNTDSEPEEELTDNMTLTLASIPVTDRVDGTNPADRTNARANTDVGPQTGRFDTLGETQNTTACPTFTLGTDMQIQIMHYGGSYKTSPKPDANYFSLGVLVTANGKSAFLAGDINNYEGAETALAKELGHVDILTLGHHGFYGSNTYSYVSGLNPEIMVMAGDYQAVSNNSAPNGEIGTLDMLLAMGKKGVPLYATSWYRDSVKALVFNFDKKLSNNIPSNKPFIGAALQTDPVEYVYYKDGFPTAYTGWAASNNYKRYFENSCLATKDKWIKDNRGRRSYIKPDGSLSTGWLEYKDSWYYFSESGYMRTGWVDFDNSWFYFDSAGKMVTGPRRINKEWYYFDSDGKMIVSAYVNGKYYGKDGTLINWQKDSSGWWYLRSDDTYPSDTWEQIDYKWYYFNASGYMVTGWLNLDSVWYYLNYSGAMLTGFQKLGDTTYYFNDSGAMMTGWQFLKADSDTADTENPENTGSLQKPESTDKNTKHWYYFTSDGAMYANGWQLIDETYYYFQEDGSMVADTWIGNYYVGADGAWIKDYSPHGNWLTDSGRWWYRHPDGTYTRSAWESIDNTWYYFDAAGWMVTGWLKLGSDWYYLSDSGAMATGWLKLGSDWYYLSDSGAMATGWLKLGSDWYYLSDSGAMVTG